MAVKPPLKWVGGKTKLLPELLARVPAKYGRYYEPFVGGGALFLALCPEAAVLGDMNGDLIDTYRTIASDVEPLIHRLEKMRARHQTGGAPYYYDVRTQWNDCEYEDDRIGRAAAFIFLNKTCFNGLWRVNRAGQMNTPVGSYKNPTIFEPENLREVAKALAHVEFAVGDYKTTTARVTKGDFVYFDPPYDPLNKTSNFTSYTKTGFGDDEQAQLAKHALELQGRGAFVMLSNNDTPFIRDLYKDFHIDTVKCARPINSKGDKRGAVDEVLITPKEPA